jgi:transcription factor MBP1
MAQNPKIYSATYSNVPVYEYNVSPGNHVMRRRADDWINATHILKVAAYDKPARTRILEREVQKGIHEKVQGGYGKYQGAWTSLTSVMHLLY